MNKTQSQKQKVIAIAAPTASGKTTLAIQLAHKINGEVISADSRLVYKGFDIACAKPSTEEMEGIPHHLIDVVEPEFDYSVANFYDDAKTKINEIILRGHTPIVCGGTGLYFRILLEDYDLPRVSANYERRKELEEKSCEELFEILKKEAPEKLEKIHINNKVRLIRTLEMLEGGDLGGKKKECEFDVQWIGIPMAREILYERINKRVDIMLEQGLVKETEKLLTKHGRIRNIVGSIGYREMIKYIDGEWSKEEAVEKIKQATRNYAKRQLTWFRRNKALGY